MSDFKFACPKCQQHLQCDEQFSGRQIQCPSCHILLHIPAIPGRTAQIPMESGQTWATYIAPAAPQAPQGIILDGKATPAKPFSP